MVQQAGRYKDRDQQEVRAGWIGEARVSAALPQLRAERARTHTPLIILAILNVRHFLTLTAYILRRRDKEGCTYKNEGKQENHRLRC